jgi:multimeric flavodoxin WrbA
MKALVLDGSPSTSSALSYSADCLGDDLRDSGWEPVRAVLRDASVASCRGCFNCWATEPGRCGQKDDGLGLTQDLARSGLLVLVTPVSFGGYGSLVKTAVERAILPFLLPLFRRTKGEFHHPLRYGRPLRLLSIGGLPRRDEQSERVFEDLVGRNARNLHSPSHHSMFVYEAMSPDEVEESVKAFIAKAGVGS